MFSFKDKELRKEFEYFKENIKYFKDSIITCNECGTIIFKYSAIEKKFVEESFDFWGKEIEICVTKYFCKKCGKKYQKSEYEKQVLKKAKVKGQSNKITK